MPAPRPLLLAGLALVAGLATGCGDLAVAVTTTSDAATAPVVVGQLPDGEHVAFLTAITTHPATVTLDLATWVADDAEPNGYRIEDPVADPVDVALDGLTEIEVLTEIGDPATATIVTVEELQAWFVDRGWAQPPLFEVVVTDGDVSGLRFVYRP